ncbi:MAG: cytochrome B [Gammaproteobacteria bacterium]|nr:cytochrome B [Gammaproteobacteria bacterium]
MAGTEQGARQVWDLPVRLMHWGLVLAVLGSWLTRKLEGDWFAWHIRCGYAVLLIAATRIVWGFVGTRHARFSDFVRGPSAILRYLRDGTDAAGQRIVGHNPLGALMVLAMLAMLLAQATLGLFANDQVFSTGPLYGYVSAATSDRLTSLHKQLFDVIVAAIVVHVVAAVFYLLVRRENLILPMVTGRKPGESLPPGATDIGPSRTLLAAAIAAALGALLWWVVRNAPEASLFAF